MSHRSQSSNHRDQSRQASRWSRAMHARPSSSMAVALVALFLALGGVAQALPGENSVDSADIIDGQVKSADVGAGAVRTGKLADGAVSTPKLSLGAVTSDKIGTDAVTADKVAGGAVRAGDIGHGAVGTFNIVPNAVTSGHVASDSLTDADLGSGAAGPSEIQTDAVANSEIRTNAVGRAEIATGAVGPDEIGTIPAVKVSGKGSGGDVPLTGESFDTDSMHAVGDPEITIKTPGFYLTTVNAHWGAGALRDDGGGVRTLKFTSCINFKTGSGVPGRACGWDDGVNQAAVPVETEQSATLVRYLSAGDTLGAMVGESSPGTAEAGVTLSVVWLG